LTAPSQSVPLSILSLLTPVNFGVVHTESLPAGNYTLEVTITDPTSGLTLPGGIGDGQLVIGSPVNATLTVNPQIVATGNSQVTTTLSVSAGASRSNPLVLLGTAQTPSPAESLALKGNLAYVCDDNEISIVDVTHPASPVLVNSVAPPGMMNDGLAHCAIPNDKLLAFVDATDSGIGSNPSFVAMSLQDPTQPQSIKSTYINKRFFMEPVYSGDTVFVPTFSIPYFGPGGYWTGQNGDVVAINISDVTNPVIKGTLETPLDPSAGGANAVFGVALADAHTLLVGSSTSTGASNGGTGNLVVADVTDPAHMSIVQQVPVPGTKQIYAPILQGNLAVALGNNGGFAGGEPDIPGKTGNVVLTTFDITDPRNPHIISTTPLPYKATDGTPAARIGDNLFLFGGAATAAGTNLLILADTTNPASPSLRTYPVPFAVTFMTAAGTILHTTDGAAGYAAYQIPGFVPVLYTAQVQVPKGTGVVYDLASFTTAPSSIVSSGASDTLVWNGTTQSTISWNSSLTSMQSGEVRPIALGGTVAFTSALGNGNVTLPLISVAAEQILSLTPATQNVQAGVAATYSLIAKNPTTSQVTYALSVTGIAAGWLTMPATVTVAAGGQATVPLTLLTPATAAPSTYAFAITAAAGGVQGSAQSQFVLSGSGAIDPPVVNNNTLGVDVVLSPAQATVGRGDSTVFAIQVSNAGGVTDTYTVSAVVPSGITVTLDRASVQVQPGATQQVNLRVSAPVNAAPGLMSVVVRATSTTKSSILQEKTAGVTVASAGVTATLSPSTAAPGATLQFAITNTGLASDTFALTVGGPVAAGVTLASTSVTLAAGASQNVSITVGAVALAGGGNFPFYATATSQSNAAVSATASANITVPMTLGVTAAFNPASQTLANPGTATFLLQVNNNGTLQDSYSAAITTTNGPIQASLTGVDNNPTQNIAQFILPASSSGLIVVNTNLTALGQGTVTVTITSLTNPQVTTTATATLATTVVPDFTVASTLASAAVAPGAIAAYPLNVTYTNGFSGTVNLSFSGLPTGATAVVTPSSLTAAGAATFAVTTASTTPAGSYPLTLTATSGSTTHSTAVSLVVGPSYDYTVALAPPAAAVGIGSATTLSVTATSVNAFGGVIAFSASGLPTGATATFTPPSLVGGGSSVLTIAAPLNTPLGNYPITVTGTSGSITRTSGTTTLSVIIPPDFGITNGTPSITLSPGATADFPLTLAVQGGFTGPVAMSAAGQPDPDTLYRDCARHGDTDGDDIEQHAYGDVHRDRDRHQWKPDPHCACHAGGEPGSRLLAGDDAWSAERRGRQQRHLYGDGDRFEQFRRHHYAIGYRPAHRGGGHL
jgi:uncharacterized membrane protein